MKILKKMDSAIIGTAVNVLQAYVPELSPQSLLEALETYNIGTAPPAKNFPEKPLTIKEASRLLSVSKATIHRYIKAGVLGKVKIGPRLIRITPESVAAVLNPNGNKV